jgi:ATP-dependent exoDNAse (exonuclease V) alpha subunit
MVLTGPAGTGKSYTLQNIIQWAQNNNKQYGITASTGLASFIIGGKTIHSFLGIGLGKKTPEDSANFVKFKNKPVFKRLQNLNMLIIDEISMIDKDFLDYISEFLAIIKNNEKPFGGIQVILSGDFCQLPPVNGSFCFFSNVWKAGNFETVQLDELMRQNNDTAFQQILQECSQQTFEILHNLRNTQFPSDIVPTRLYSKNINVDQINLNELAKLKEQGQCTRIYQPIFKGGNAWCKHITDVELCIGTQVMCTTNITGTGIVNGTRGVVIDMTPNDVTIKMMNNQVQIIPIITTICEDDKKQSVTYLPLKLAWAITIHKSQGMTLDALEIDIGNSIFEYGQAYVAISRARSLESIRIIDIKKSSFKTHPHVLKFYNI